jgi:hypothetical protein
MIRSNSYLCRSQQFIGRDGQVADALAGSIEYRVGDGSRKADQGNFDTAVALIGLM